MQQAKRAVVVGRRTCGTVKAFDRSRRRFLSETVTAAVEGAAASFFGGGVRAVAVGGAAVANWVTAAGAADADAGGKRNFIDAHSHVWDPRASKAFPLAKGFTEKDLDPPSFTPEELLAVARPEGVRRVVLIQHTIYHRTDNRYLADCIRRLPGTFSGVATIDDRGPRPDREMRRLKEQGFRGFRIVPRDWQTGRDQLPPNEWLGSDGLRVMWKTAAETGLAICPLIDPEYLPALDATCRAFPKTTVVVDHFARVGIDGTIRERDLKNLCRLSRHANVYVKVSAYYALGKKRPPYTDLLPMIRRVYEAFGPQRLMWASDAPYQIVPPHTYAASIALIRDTADFLSAEDREWLLRRTAEKVFFAK